MVIGSPSMAAGFGDNHQCPLSKMEPLKSESEVMLAIPVAQPCSMGGRSLGKFGVGLETVMALW